MFGFRDFLLFFLANETIEFMHLTLINNNSNCCIRNCIKFIIEFCVGKINVVPATTTAAAAAVVGATAAVSLQYYGIKFCVLVIRYAFNWQLCFKRNAAGKNGSSLAVVMVFPSVYKIY